MPVNCHVDGKVVLDKHFKLISLVHFDEKARGLAIHEKYLARKSICAISVSCMMSPCCGSQFTRSPGVIVQREVVRAQRCLRPLGQQKVNERSNHCSIGTHFHEKDLAMVDQAETNV